MPAKPCPQVPHPHGVWTPPGMGTPSLPWAAWANTWPLSQERSFSPIFNLNLPWCNLRPWKGDPSPHITCFYWELLLLWMQIRNSIFLVISPEEATAENKHATHSKMQLGYYNKLSYFHKTLPPSSSDAFPNQKHQHAAKSDPGFPFTWLQGHSVLAFSRQPSLKKGEDELFLDSGDRFNTCQVWEARCFAVHALVRPLLAKCSCEGWVPQSLANSDAQQPGTSPCRGGTPGYL